MRMNVFVLIALFSFYSCGDLAAYKKEIYKHYYLVEGDLKGDISLCYRTEDDDFIGRVSGPLVEYGLIADSFIVAKKVLKGGEKAYYIVDIKSDDPYAEEASFLVGILSEEEFEVWKNNKRPNLILRPVR